MVTQVCFVDFQRVVNGGEAAGCGEIHIQNRTDDLDNFADVAHIKERGEAGSKQPVETANFEIGSVGIAHRVGASTGTCEKFPL